MNKTELINAIAAEGGFSKLESKKALDSMLKCISNALIAGDKVSLVGFGTFIVAERSARVGVNPTTKLPIQISAQNAVKFKISSELKAALN